jgi:hypothetical protein
MTRNCNLQPQVRIRQFPQLTGGLPILRETAIWDGTSLYKKGLLVHAKQLREEKYMDCLVPKYSIKYFQQYD